MAREVSLKPKKVCMHTRRSKNTKKTFHVSVHCQIQTQNWNCEHRLGKNPGFAGTLHPHTEGWVKRARHRNVEC